MMEYWNSGNLKLVGEKFGPIRPVRYSTPSFQYSTEADKEQK
jgi:hypothetical protein